MHPTKHRSNTARLGPPPGTPEGNVQELNVTRIMIGSKRPGDFPPALEAPGPIVRSFWRPTDEELRALLKGRSIVFQCWGYSHPPVFIGVEGEGPLDLVGVLFPDPEPLPVSHKEDGTKALFRAGCMDDAESAVWETQPGMAIKLPPPGSTTMRPSEFRAARGDLFGQDDRADALGYDGNPSDAEMARAKRAWENAAVRITPLTPATTVPFALSASEAEAMSKERDAYSMVPTGENRSEPLPDGTRPASPVVFFDGEGFVGRQLREEQYRGLEFWHVGCKSPAATSAMLMPNSEAESRIGPMRHLILTPRPMLKCTCCGVLTEDPSSDEGGQDPAVTFDVGGKAVTVAWVGDGTNERGTVLPHITVFEKGAPVAGTAFKHPIIDCLNHRAGACWAGSEDSRCAECPVRKKPSDTGSRNG